MQRFTSLCLLSPRLLPHLLRALIFGLGSSRPSRGSVYLYTQRIFFNERLRRLKKIEKGCRLFRFEFVPGRIRTDHDLEHLQCYRFLWTSGKSALGLVFGIHADSHLIRVCVLFFWIQFLPAPDLHSN